MKIAIIGYSGAGKSTLAKYLSQHYHIPLLYMDHVKFKDHWESRTLNEQINIVNDFINQHSDWVIDGNYANIVPDRFIMADLLIFLNYNRFYCFIQCLIRYLKHIGKRRESCPCIEKFDYEFIKWILYEGRTSKQKEKHKKHMDMCKGKVLVFTNRRELKIFLESL